MLPSPAPTMLALLSTILLPFTTAIPLLPVDSSTQASFLHLHLPHTPLHTKHNFHPRSACPAPYSLPKVHITPLICPPCAARAHSRATDVLLMNYNGTLASNGSLFDTSYTPEHPWPAGDPFNFTLGSGEVIDGFDAGLYDMCPGEVRSLRIESEYGYGSDGVDGVIPGNATLIFDAELVAVMIVKQNGTLMKREEDHVRRGVSFWS
ncbi:hypothetical protein K402DRAFT_450590 [Aulographum hederae CBS 113979]|uniref:peptidylprolyl isomerase n=1 Tax=Aulographum hederae CBS 113979 TaxID=1176131 RepID=A0A6G1HEV9_9PEZI|nr:hypothetical protein K402DRAFT_450590 [Aulographum hederae CBS 113979]